VEILLRRDNADPNKVHDGHTPFLSAVQNGQEGVVKMLLGRGDVNPNTPGRYGVTPLHCAAGSGDERVVAMLLGRGDIIPDSRDMYGQIPLWYAAAAGGHEG